MSRQRSSGSYGHGVTEVVHGVFLMSWTVDYYYVGDRKRYPRRFRRHTDTRGARKFAERHGCRVRFLDGGPKR